MRKLLCVLALVAATLFLVSAKAAEVQAKWDAAPDRISDLAALQNGAKLFVNYCLNCHSANAVRYNSLNKIGLSDQQIEHNLLFTGKKVGDLMHIAMRPEDAQVWFGVVPPDLSLMARAKSANFGQSGTDYIYTYLRSFYRDTSRPNGWNNVLLPNAAMPNPLADLSGPRKVTLTAVKAVDDGKQPQYKAFITVYDEDGYKTVQVQEPSSQKQASVFAQFHYQDLTKQQSFDDAVGDLSAFLAWVAEPKQEYRKTLGTYVLIFLAIFFIIAWLLNRSYWKHVE